MIGAWGAGFLVLRLGAGSVLRVGRARDWAFSDKLGSMGVEVLEDRPLTVSGSNASPGRPSTSSRLFPAVTGIGLPVSLSLSRCKSEVLASGLTGPSRGVDLGSAGFAVDDLGQSWKVLQDSVLQHTRIRMPDAV